MTPAAAQLAEALGKPKKPRKFRNVPIIVDDMRFDSKAEARCWELLKIRVRLGEISELDRQRAFPLIVNGSLVTTYVSDFSFKENGNLVVVDVKSPRTRAEPAFRLKMRLLEALEGIQIRIVA